VTNKKGFRLRERDRQTDRKKERKKERKEGRKMERQKTFFVKSLYILKM